jgi:hypothetical protein
MNNRLISAVFVLSATLFILVGHSPGTLAATDLRAGAAVSDITPQVGVSLDGPISKNGPVTAIHDRLHARALVLADGTTQLALVVCDACMIGRDVFDAAKEIAHRQTGLPVTHMLMSATHTHAAPRATHIGTSELDDEYHRFLAQRIAEAVVQANANLAPAQIGWTSFPRPDLIRCRRSLCEPGSVGANPFGDLGERIKSVSGKSNAVIEPAGPVDPQFSVLSVRHVDGKPLAVMGNFSVHYCGGYQRGLVSADYFGHFAAALQADLDAGDSHPPFVGMMSNGTSGNTGAIERNGKSYPPFEWMKVSARILADETLQKLKTIDYRRNTPLAVHEAELALAVRRPDAERLAWARKMQNVPSKKHPHRWTSVYVNEALHLEKYPPTMDLKLQAIRIGELAIAGIPCEVFAETGLQIKKESPHKATFVMELANGYGGYLPPPRQHELGGYETWPARSSFLETAAEPRIRDMISQLLHKVRRQP